MNTVDPADANLPKFIQTITNKVNKGITKNSYDKHDYKNMVLNCSHSNQSQQHELINLFGQFEELFSGKLSAIPNYKVHLKLKKDSKPYFVNLY